MPTVEPETAKSFFVFLGQTGPVTQGIILALILVVVLLLAVKPLLGLVRTYKSEGADNALADARKSQFEQLESQIKENAKNLRDMNLENAHLHTEVIHLRARVESLEKYEEMVDNLKTKLDQKDAHIEALMGDNRMQATENKELLREMLKMQERLHDLEMRVTKDELAMCSAPACPQRTNTIYQD